MKDIDQDPTFNSRKADHIKISTDPLSQSLGSKRPSDQIKLKSTILPEINFSDIKIEVELIPNLITKALFISSMTGGHEEGIKTNHTLAECAVEKNWVMGVGSQRKELFDNELGNEWRLIRKRNPKLNLISNIGLSQLIEFGADKILKILESTDPLAIFVHSNPLQEAIQVEGTPNFKGGLKALLNLCEISPVPVVLKEVGFGMSCEDLLRLNELKLFAVDLSGSGGTHWGKVESLRVSEDRMSSRLGFEFENWGYTSAETLHQISKEKLDLNFQIWASGGVRSGLDAACLLAAGAKMVGIASPLMRSALKGSESLLDTMNHYENGLKIAMFGVGVTKVKSFSQNKYWEWVK